MNAHRFGAGLALLVVFGACGADRAPEPAAAATATAVPSGLRFVKPPRVYVESGYAEIWVRLNRPVDRSASLDVPGAEHDLPGLQGAPLRPTCFYEGVSVPLETSRLEDGAPIEVTLTVSETERLVATGTVVARAPGSEPTPEGELACPTKERGKPRLRRCHGQVDDTPFMLGISITSARGTSCRRAEEVMASVGKWANSSRCWEDLCASKHRINRGFRCEAELTGEAAWDIVCRRGRAEVRGFTAE